MEPTEEEAKKGNQDWSSLPTHKVEDDHSTEGYRTWRNEARQIITMDSKSNFTELLSLARPPEEVKKILDAHLYALGHKTEKERSSYLSSIKAKKYKIINDSMNFKPESLSFKDCKTLQKMLEGLSEEVLKTKSLASAIIYRWIDNMVQLRIISAQHPETTQEVIAEEEAKKSEEDKKAEEKKKRPVTSTKPVAKKPKPVPKEEEKKEEKKTRPATAVKPVVKKPKPAPKEEDKKEEKKKRPVTAVKPTAPKKPKAAPAEGAPKEEKKRAPTTVKPMVKKTKPAEPEVEKEWNELPFKRSGEELSQDAITEWRRQTRLEVSNKDLTELRAFARPPEIAIKVVTAFMHVINKISKKGESAAWNEFKAKTQEHLRAAERVKLGSIEKKSIIAAQRNLQDLGAENVRKVSKVATDIFTWVDEIIQLRIALALNPDYSTAVEEVEQSMAPVLNETKVQEETDKLKKDQSKLKKKAEKLTKNKSNDKKESNEEEKVDFSSFNFTGNAEDCRDPRLGEWVERNYEEAKFEKKAISELISLKSPPKDVKEVLEAIILAKGAKTKTAIDSAWKELNSKGIDFIKQLSQVNPCHIGTKEFDKINDLVKDKSPESMKAKSSASVNLLNWLLGIIQIKVGTELHGRKVQVRDNSGWNQIVFFHNEDECNQERFEEWKTSNFEKIKEFSKKDMDGLAKTKTYTPNGQRVLHAVAYILGYKSDADRKSFETKLQKNQIGLHEFLPQIKLENLSLLDCKYVQKFIEGISKNQLRSSNKSLEILHEFVENLVQLRTAIGLFGDRTGYSINDEESKAEGHEEPGVTKESSPIEETKEEAKEETKEEVSAEPVESETQNFKEENHHVEENHVEEAKNEETPAEEAHNEETPVEETPSQETPVEEIHNEETPVEEAQDTLEKEAPVQDEAPTQEAAAEKESPAE